MCLKSKTNEMLYNLYLINTGEKEDYEFAGFATGKNGHQVTFDREFEDQLIIVSLGIFNNSNHDFRIEENQFKKIVKKAIVNLICLNKIDFNPEFDNLELIREEVKSLIGELQLEHVHIVAAKTLAFEQNAKLKIGPTTIYSLKDWIEISESPKEFIEKHGDKEINLEWKKNLLMKINDPNHQISGVAKQIYEVIKDSNSVIKVYLTGFEYEFSKKLSKMVAKLSLDMISLFLGGQKSFFQQIIHDERLGPSMTHDLGEYNGYLGLPGHNLGKQVQPIFFSEESMTDFFIKFEDFKKNFEYVLEGFIHQQNTKHPLLTHRWIFALRWYAEGVREPDDAIAVAKLACCLDALSNGGRLGGIKNLLSNTLGIKSDQIIFKDKVKNVDLHAFVKRIYDQGRSRILHGTIEDMLESYELDKLRLIDCCRLVLLETLVRLNRYEGEDTGKAFQSMK